MRLLTIPCRRVKMEVAIAVDRRTVDLTAYPNLVVVYLGMRVRRPRDAAAVGDRAADQKVLEAATRWPLVARGHHLVADPAAPRYARVSADLESLERWTRSEPHKLWWQGFLARSGGIGFWHETYFMRGGMEAIYDDVEPEIGFARFAPLGFARGARFSARRRAGHGEQPTVQPVITEADYYSSSRRRQLILTPTGAVHRDRLLRGLCQCCVVDPRSVRRRVAPASAAPRSRQRKSQWLAPPMMVWERRNSQSGREHRLCREVDTAGEQRPDVGCSDRAKVLCEPAYCHVDRASRVRVGSRPT